MLRPTFLGFEVAKRGLSTSQKGLDITGQNMTNWDSKGYTRQRIDQVAIATSAYSSRFGSNRIAVTGQGVAINGVAQIRDSFLDKRFRDEYSDEGYYGQVSNILSDIESAIGEFNPNSTTGLRGSLETLLPALQKFADTPYSETSANIIATEFRNLTQTLHHLSSKLNSVQSQQTYNLKMSVQEVNTKFEQLANLNYAIQQDLGLTVDNEYYGPNELLDQRNLLLDELSRYGDIEVIPNADQTVTVKFGDHVAVDGAKHEKIQMNENSNGTVSLGWLSTGDRLGTVTGLLKGATDFINGRGPNVINQNESPYNGIPYYRDQLNTFANTLASVVNNVIPDTVDAAGNVLTYKTLLGGLSSTPDASGNYPVLTNIVVTADNISISDDWTADSSYIIFQSDNKDNNYILDLYSALTLKDSTFMSNGETFKGTFLDFVDNYAGNLGEDISFYEGRHTATSTIVSELYDRRDSISGVVLDEEVSNMMMYNKSYQAASRLMTTLDEALDVLINKTGLVGR